MNFGEKFPYALLTFSQSLSKLVIGVHLLPKVCRSWLLGTLHPNHYPHAQLHINSHTPSSISTPYPHTPTPTIHPPYTIPQPRPYPSSCELTATKWGKTARFVAHKALDCSQRAPYGAKSPRSGLRACAGANEGGWGVRPVWVVSESCQVCAVKVPANLTIFPKITQTVKKLPN